VEISRLGSEHSFVGDAGDLELDAPFDGLDLDMLYNVLINNSLYEISLTHSEL